MTGIVCALATASTFAHERIFTYSYEASTPPKGEFEYEQHVTLRAGRTGAVGQEDYRRFEFREELEYGVTDRWQASLYLNQSFDHFTDPGTGQRVHHFESQGVSLENIFMVLDPKDHKFGFALYLEPTWNNSEFELEQKLLFSQRYEKWRWAVNFTHATEWENNFRGQEGEFETTVGVSRELSPRWSVGVEFRNHNEIPEYEEWENTAFHLGPVVCYKRQNWFATLSVMPQVFGMNFTGNVDSNTHLELEGHEKLNVRLIFGFDF